MNDKAGVAAPRNQDDDSAEHARGFLTPEDSALGQQFLGDGYVIQPVDDTEALQKIRAAVVAHAAEHLGVSDPGDDDAFLNTVHERVTVADLNAMRLAVYYEINAAPWLREAYFGLARQSIEALVGNELAMQRRVNLSVQLPNDDSSLLPVHADVWSGDSPFEIVVWLPLVDCHRTKSMYLLPPGPDRAVSGRLQEFASSSAEDLFRAIEPDVEWIDIKFGQVLLFAQSLMHGNRINLEPDTRWSMNCRFKSLFSPYADKRLGEFFEPITVRAATRLGMDYKLPGGFE
jgi:sporadic carbohydrate cluster 2OG-Fe(II) oxygenase